jgi:hypothetical protein
LKTISGMLKTRLAQVGLFDAAVVMGPLPEGSFFALRSTGCADIATLQVPGGNPDDIAVDAATDTVYVATLTSSGPDLVSVFNGATCNATSTSGCGQTPTTIAAGASGDRSGNSSLNLAVNQATNTIYASNVFNTDRFSPPPFLGNSVYVINGATCDGANTTGCGQTPATVTLASNPRSAPTPWESPSTKPLTPSTPQTSPTASTPAPFR